MFPCSKHTQNEPGLRCLSGKYKLLFNEKISILAYISCLFRKMEEVKKQSQRNITYSYWFRQDRVLVHIRRKFFPSQVNITSHQYTFAVYSKTFSHLSPNHQSTEFWKLYLKIRIRFWCSQILNFNQTWINTVVVLYVSEDISVEFRIDADKFRNLANWSMAILHLDVTEWKKASLNSNAVEISPVLAFTR